MSKEVINDLIAGGERFISCFQFCLKDGKVISLTSSDQKIIYENISYLPNSGIIIENALFNDSAHNSMTLKGVFELGGIDKNLDLDGARVKIFYHFPQKTLLLQWLDMWFSEIKYDGLNFILTLKSEIFKLHKNVLQNFSTNCRANFGDNKCKVQVVAYSGFYEVISIENNIIKIGDCTRPDGFFTGGRASFNDGSVYEIKSHSKSLLTLFKHCALKAPQRVILAPSCDKNFVTCCNRYKNAVNFRGEPSLPWQQGVK